MSKIHLLKMVNQNKTPWIKYPSEYSQINILSKLVLSGLPLVMVGYILLNQYWAEDYKG